jgi:hypothetical protein
MSTSTSPVNPTTHPAEEATVTCDTMTIDQLEDQMRVTAVTASAAMGLEMVHEWRTGRYGLIKAHSPLQARLGLDGGAGVLTARMTGAEGGPVEVSGAMCDVLEALTQHFEG